MDEEKKPENLQDCLDILNKNYKEGGWHEFKNMDEEDAVTCCHHSTGRNMRNNWNLWDDTYPLVQWFNRIGIKHADDMSGIIIASFHRQLNGKPLDLDGQVIRYKEYWADVENGILRIPKKSALNNKNIRIDYLACKKPDDRREEKPGWVVKEVIGIGIINEYAVLPWYKKMKYMRFYTDFFHKIIRKIKLK